MAAKTDNQPQTSKAVFTSFQTYPFTLSVPMVLTKSTFIGSRPLFSPHRPTHQPKEPAHPGPPASHKLLSAAPGRADQVQGLYQ